MKSLGDSLRKALAHKHLGNQMVGAVAMNAVRNFFGMPELEGHVRFNILFLKITDQAFKIQIFKQKNQILHEANLAIEKVGYTTKLQEIRIKN